jgi:NADH:ubiquinone reductase (H+-translocating)
MEKDHTKKPGIVVIGGGFAGLEAAFTLKGLVSSSADITLIDRSPYHYFIPSIHEIISGKVEPGQIRIPLHVLLAPAGIAFIEDEVLDLDRGRRQVSTNSAVLDYDYLILGMGAENNFFDIPGAAEHAYCFRSSGDAERIKRELVRIMADESCSYTVMVAGGGTEGVEVTGEVVDAVEKGCGRDALRSERITIELIEGQDRLLPGFPDQVRDFAGDYLRKRGVKLTTGSRITEVQENSVVLDTTAVRAMSLLIWTGGIQSPKLIRTLSLPKDPTGWLKVNEHLQLFDDDRAYGIGDAVTVYRGGEPLHLARLAYHAQDQARFAALNIANQLAGEDLASYAPKSKPQLVSMGRNMGLYIEGDEFRSGSWVVSLKKGIEKQHLLSYLTKPVSSALWAKIPGSAFLNRRWLQRTV